MTRSLPPHLSGLSPSLDLTGTFKEVEIYGKQYKGKALYDILDNYVRKGFVAVDKAEREKGRDMMWYIWLNENSPTHLRSGTH